MSVENKGDHKLIEINEKQGNETIRVQCLTLDSSPVSNSNIDLIKMDIEGAELGALRGMRKTIQNSPNLSLVMEYNPQALRGFGHDPVSALFEVMAMGFNSLQAIEEDGSLTDLALDKSLLEEKTAVLMRDMGVLNVLLKR